MLFPYIHCLQQTQGKTPERSNKRPRSSRPEESSAHVDADIVQNERCLAEKLISITPESISVTETTIGLNSDASVGAAISPETGTKQRAVEHQNKVSASNDPELISNNSSDCKKQKMLSATDVVNAPNDTIPGLCNITSTRYKHEDIHGLPKIELQRNDISLSEATGQAKEKVPPSDISSCDNLDTSSYSTVEVKELSTLKLSVEAVNEQVEGTCESSEWKLMEKELYMKGIEIFGRNRWVLRLTCAYGYEMVVNAFS